METLHRELPSYSEKTSSVLPSGSIRERKLAVQPLLKYYLYIPEGCTPSSKIFISVHGISRNAREHAELFSSYAERYGLILVAPRFTRKHFCDYQRLGQKGTCRRSDKVLHAIVKEVKTLTGNRTGKFLMFGYSGGAQFVHRYIMAYPDHVDRAVIAAAGWYTFPDPTLEYPLGTKTSSSMKDITMNAFRFLSVPVSVLVGELDNERDHDLRKSDYLFHQQGLSRIERGRRWAKVMKSAARTYNLNTSYEFMILPRSGHSFAECMEKGDMGRHVFKSFFGSSEFRSQ